MLNNKNNEKFPSRSMKNTEINRHEGAELIQAVKKQIYTDPKNSDNYKHILNEAQVLYNNNKLDNDEIARLDLMLTQVLLPVKEVEDLKEPEPLPVVTPIAKVIVPAPQAGNIHQAIQVQENKNDKSGGDLPDQTKPQLDEPQSLYPTLYFSSADYDTSKLNKDISELFVVQNVPSNSIQASKKEEINPKEILEKNINAFAEKLQDRIRILEDAIATKQLNGYDLSHNQVLSCMARLEKVKATNELFDKFKSKFDDSKRIQRYEDLLEKAYNPTNSVKVAKTPISTNTASFVAHLAVENEKNKPAKAIKKIEKQRAPAV